MILVRQTLEFFLELAVSAFICVRMMESEFFTSYWAETLSSILAIATLAMLTYVPIYLIYAAYKYNNELDNPLTRLQFKRVFMDFKKYEVSALLYFPVFLVRRLVFVLLICFAMDT